MGGRRTAVGTRVLLAKTCTKCCVLKQASEFPRITRRGEFIQWGSWCKSCEYKLANENKSNLKYRHRVNESLPRPQRGKLYSQDDVDVLLRDDLSTLDMAKLLGRSLDAVHAARGKLLRGEDLARPDGKRRIGPRTGKTRNPDGSVTVGKRTLLARTCRSCGILKPGTAFKKKADGRYSKCKSCGGGKGKRKYKYKYSAKASKRAMKNWASKQAITMDADPYKNGEPYTGADWEILLRDDLTTLEKALMLHRTYSAVASALSSRRRGDPTPRRLTEGHPL